MLNAAGTGSSWRVTRDAVCSSYNIKPPVEMPGPPFLESPHEHPQYLDLSVIQASGNQALGKDFVDRDWISAGAVFDEFLLAEFAKLRLAILNEYEIAVRKSVARPSCAASPEQEDTTVRTANCVLDTSGVISQGFGAPGEWSMTPAQGSFIEAQHTIRPRSTGKRNSTESALPWPAGESSILSLPESEERQRRISFLFYPALTSNPDIPQEPFLTTVAESPMFDMAIAAVVLVNCIFLCFETQLDGIETGNKLFAHGNVQYTDEIKRYFQILDYLFLSIYVIEFSFKLSVLRCRYFRSLWNVLDGMSVVIPIIALVLSSGGKVLNPALVRIFRLAKLFRLTHILRSLTFFNSYVILVRSLKASVGALFWSLFFILVMISSSAFFVNQLIIEHLRLNWNNVGSDQVNVFLRFGTYTRSVWTMFEITLGNWGPPAWLLINHVHEAWGVYIIIYKCTAGFAMLNVINAVFLRQTMKQADALDSYTLEQEKKDAQKYKARMEELFYRMDTSGDGKLSFDEFQLVCESNTFKAWMRLMNVGTHDVDGLWRAIDNGDGYVDMTEFLEGFSKLDGYATAVDVFSIKALIRDCGNRNSWAAQSLSTSYCQ